MEENTQNSLADFLDTIKRRKYIILMVFVVTIVLSMLITSFTPPTYQADSKILVKTGRGETLVIPGGSPGEQYTKKTTIEELNSQIEIITSRPLLEKVIEILGPDKYLKQVVNRKNFLSKSINLLKQAKEFIEKLFSYNTHNRKSHSSADKVLRKLEDELKVRVLMDSHIIKISFRENNPQLTADVVNTLAGLYLDNHLKSYQSSEAYRFFTEQTQLWKDKLEESETMLKQYRQEQNIVNLDSQKEKNLEKLTDFEAEFKNTQGRIKAINHEITYLEKQLKNEPTRIIALTREFKNPIVAELQNRLIQLEIDKRRLLRRYSEDNIKVKDIQEEISEAKRMMKNEDEKIKEESSNINPVYQSILMQRHQAKTKLSSSKTKETVLKSQIGYYRNLLNDLDSKKYRLTQLERKVKRGEDAYSLYLKRQEDARIADAMDKRRIINLSIIEYAALPKSSISPKPFFNFILSMIIGLVGGVGIAFVLDRLDYSVKSDQDINKYIKLPLLATIPERKKGVMAFR